MASDACSYLTTNITGTLGGKFDWWLADNKSKSELLMLTLLLQKTNLKRSNTAENKSSYYYLGGSNIFYLPSEMGA